MISRFRFVFSTIILFTISCSMLCANVLGTISFGETSTFFGKKYAEPLSFTDEEKEVITKSESKAVRIGIIPNLYPMSIYSPEGDKFQGIVPDMLDLISKKSGLKFEYVKIPIESYTPIQYLKTGNVDLVAGNLRMKFLLADETLVISDGLFDASMAFAMLKGVNIDELTHKPINIAMLNSFQAGREYLLKKFNNFNIVSFNTAEECMDAVKSGKTDIALINKYVASYLLQKPYYNNIEISDKYFIELENSISARLGDEVLISIINKTIKSITIHEYNHILMTFTINSPYPVTFADFLYKYRYIMAIFFVLMVVLLYFILRFLDEEKKKDELYFDKLTGLYSMFGFEKEAERMLKSTSEDCFIIDFDIARFDGFNVAYGREEGNRLLTHVADIIKNNEAKNEITARVYADHFVTFSNGATKDVIITKIKRNGRFLRTQFPDIKAYLAYGIYEITEKDIPVETMIDRAITARRSIKGSSERYYAVYDENLHAKSVEDASIISCMENSLANREFYVEFQYKNDVLTGKIVGAEALLRWKREDEVLYPERFIEIFEKSGQIMRLDFYVLNICCELMRNIIDRGITPIPISVNFSRAHLYNQSFVAKFTSVIKSFDIPPELIEIELTESAVTYDQQYILPVIERLRSCGITISVDDFGSKYSSLSTIKDWPVDILKLDKGFLSYENDRTKGQEIIRTLLKLAKTLSMRTVVEGVETREQLEFLKNCENCDIVQGYYYSCPEKADKFIETISKIK